MLKVDDRFLGIRGRVDQRICNSKPAVHVPTVHYSKVDYINGRFICAKCDIVNEYENLDHYPYDGRYIACGSCGSLNRIIQPILPHKDSLPCDYVVQTCQRESEGKFFDESHMSRLKTKMYNTAKWSDRFNGYLMEISTLDFYRDRQYYTILVYLNGRVETSIVDDSQRYFLSRREAHQQYKELLSL